MMTIIPIPAPKYVGQSIPLSGSTGAGVAAATGGAVAQIQLVDVWQDGFLQLPVVAPLAM